MSKPRVGIALCGSYCTYDKLFSQLAVLADKYELVPIMSETAAATDTRFGTSADFISRLSSLCGAQPVHSIAEAEPLGKDKPRHNRHGRHHGGKGASEKLKAAGHCIFDKRRALGLGSEHCGAFKPQKRLFRSLQAG